MPRLIPAAERIQKARASIQKARDLPIPEEAGRNNLSYIAQVKKLMQEARDLVKFIPMTPSATAEMKADVKLIVEESQRAEREILRGQSSLDGNGTRASEGERE